MLWRGSSRTLLTTTAMVIAGCGDGSANPRPPSGAAGAAFAGAATAGAPAALGQGGKTSYAGGESGHPSEASGSGGTPTSAGAGAGGSAGPANGGGGWGGTVTLSGHSGASGIGFGGAGGQASSATGAGASNGGGAAGASGKLNSNGGATGGPYPDLRFSGLVSALELAPLRLATNGVYPAKITIASGGIDALCGTNPSADIATNAETQFLRATGGTGCEKVRIIFTMCEGLYRIVAKKSAGIATLADLAGKHVMAPSGASSAYYLSKMLSAAGLTAGTGADQVNVVNGSANGSTFSGGSAPDAATIWEPGIEQASEELGSDAIEFQHDQSDTEVYRELFNLHTTTDVLADPAKRRGIVELVRELVAASASLRADPTAADSLLTGPAGVNESVLSKSMKYERFAGTLVSDLLDVMMEEEPWRANIDGRAARSRDELATYIDDSVLTDALAGM